MLQPGKGDRRIVTADVRQGRGLRQRARETYQKRHAGNEATIRWTQSMDTVKTGMEAEVGNSMEIKHENASAEAINKVKQDSATKEIEQRLRQEIEKQKLNESLCRIIPAQEATESATNGKDCKTLKMVTRKPFGITKIGVVIMSIIPLVT